MWLGSHTRIIVKGVVRNGSRRFPGAPGKPLARLLQLPTKCSCNFLHFCSATSYIFIMQHSKSGKRNIERSVVRKCANTCCVFRMRHRRKSRISASGSDLDTALMTTVISSLQNRGDLWTSLMPGASRRNTGNMWMIWATSPRIQISAMIFHSDLTFGWHMRLAQHPRCFEFGFVMGVMLCEYQPSRSKCKKGAMPTRHHSQQNFKCYSGRSDVTRPQLE